MTDLENLHDVNWVAVSNAPFVMKYLFNSTGYNILISNLTVIYGEKLQEKDVKKRFYKLNPFAEMKSQVILENLKKSLEQSLNNNSDLNLKVEEKSVTLKLLFPAAQVKCSYDIVMDLLPPEQVMHYVIQPTVFNALLSQQRVTELLERISSSETINSSSVHTAGISKNILNPEWLSGANVPTETVLGYFLKIQSYFQQLCIENNKAYYLKKERAENISVSAVSPKKCKVDEHSNSKSSNIKFEEDEEAISVKEERLDVPSQEMQIPTKRKKIIKF